MTIRRVLIALLLLAAVGCAADRQVVARKEVVPVGTEVRTLRFPFDRYEFSRLDFYTIQYAEDLLTRACMRNLGMDWELLPPPPAHDPDPLNRRHYGLIEPEIAARHGYHRPPPPPELAVREPVWARRYRLPPKERRAAYGHRGCRTQARDHLGEDATKLHQSRLNDFLAEEFRDSRKQPEVVNVIKNWCECMAREGFDYADPFQAAGDVTWADSQRALPREIAVATADVRCKQRTNLVTLWAGVERRVQLGLIRSHPEDFENFRRAKDASLNAARQTASRYG